jgi:hypothetical protein
MYRAHVRYLAYRPYVIAVAFLMLIYGNAHAQLPLDQREAKPTGDDRKQLAGRAEALRRIKKLAFATIQYEDTFGVFPQASSNVYRKSSSRMTSKYPHSWRVDLLPFLNQEALFRQYKLDEPWDSEANKKVLAQMPEVFRAAEDSPNSTNTSFFVLTGPQTMFPEKGNVRMSHIQDGAAMTLLIVEAKRSVPWTKPEDIPYAADQPVPKLGGWVEGEFLAAFADGYTQRVSANLDEPTLRAYITKDGRERLVERPSVPTAP